MARATFGGTAADYVVTTGADGLLRLSSATLTMWTAATGGTQITDLLLGGSPVTSVPVGADGSVPTFQGPDGVTELWADAGHGRVRLTAPVTVVDSAVAALASNPASATGSALVAPLQTFDANSAYGQAFTDTTTSYGVRSKAKRGAIKWVDNMSAGWTPWGTSTHGDQTQTVHVSSDFGTIAQYVAHGNYSYGGIEKTGLNLDLTKYDLVVRFLLPSMTTTSAISVWIGNPEANNYWSAKIANLTDPVRGIVAGVPATVILPIEQFTANGTAPSTSRLANLRFAFDTINNGVDTTFQIVGLGLIPKQDRPKIVLTFDDSGIDVYSFVFPTLRQRGLRATAFVDGLSASQSGRPTVANYRSMQSCGWEIAAHTWGGPSGGHNSYELQTRAWRLNYLAKIKKWHIDNGFPTDVFAWPNGHCDTASVTDVSRFFACARGVSDSPPCEGAVAGNPYAIRTFVAGSAKLLSEYTTQLDLAIAGKMTQVFTFHSVTPDASESTLYITQALFTQFADYLKAKVDAGLVDVVSMSEAFLDAPNPQRRAQVNVFSTSGTWTKADWATTVSVTCIGAGGGGGGGYRGAAGVARGGGGGGGGGSVSTVQFAAADLPSSVAVSVGTGGAGGTSATADSTSGGAGGGGGSSTFGTSTDAWYVEAGRGTGGSGGGSATGGAAGGVGNGGVYTGSNGGAGSSGSAVGASGGSTGNGAAGGGGGGGLSTANALSAAGAGGKNLSNPGVSAAAGATDGAAGGAGYGRAGTTPSTGASGGGGGAASVAGAGGAGGAGGWPGGGGGGGGASVNGQASGAGGAGAGGVVVVISYP